MKVLIADDHPLFRDALARMVRECAPDTLIVEAGSLDEARRALDDCTDLLLIDLRMPGGAPADVVGSLHALQPTLPIVVVSGSENPLDARHALAQGAVCFLRKSLPPDTLRRHLATLLAGELPDDTDAGPFAAQAAAPALTPRQLEVLRALSGGATNKHIARALGLTEGTVKLHVAAVIGALGVGNRTEAAARARDLGLA